MSCGIKPCGRQDLAEPGPGLELVGGKYSCTLCYVNPAKYDQPVFKRNVIEEHNKKVARPKEPEQPKPALKDKKLW